MSTPLSCVRRARLGRAVDRPRAIESLERRRLLSVTWEITDAGTAFTEGGAIAFLASPSEPADPADYTFNWNVTLDEVAVADTDALGHTFGAIAPNQGSLDVSLTVTENATSLSTTAAPLLDLEIFNTVPRADAAFFFDLPEGPIAEGQTVQFAVVAFDDGPQDVLHYTVRVAKLVGTTFELQFVVDGGMGTGQVEVPIKLPDEGTWAFVGEVFDDVLASDRTPGVTLNVVNAAPEPTVSGDPGAPVDVGTEINLSVAHNDPGESNATLYPTPPYDWGLVDPVSHDDTHTFEWVITRLDDNTVVATGDTDQISFTPTEGGTYEYVVTVTDNALDAGMASGSILVVEDVADEASLAYSGLQHIATESASDTTARVDLRATLTDIGEDAADIGSALVAFSVYHPLDGLIHSSQVGVSSSDGVVGVASDSFIYTLTAPDAALTVVVEVVGGGYTADPLSVPLTVSRAETGRVVGAGIMQNTNSGGSLAAAAGSRTMFAFTARRTSGSLTGAFSMTYLGADGNAYMVVSTDVSSLFTWTEGGVGRAAMSAEVDVYHVRRIHGPALVHSDLTLEMTLTDAGHNGHFDRAAFAVWNPAGGLVFGSYIDPTTNSVTEQLLDAGNITVWSS